jgi:ketosteroid isomerase-like protein
VLPYLDPELDLYSPPEVANSGRFHGHEGYLTWVRTWLDAWDDFTITPVEFIPAGPDDVVAVVDISGRGKESGIPVQMRLAYLYTVREGKATRFHLHLDRESALAAAGRPG